MARRHLRAKPAGSTALARGVAVAVTTLLAAVACTPAVPADGVASVVEVVDGDTLTVRFGPTTEDVRLLGVDTPETVHPTRPVECFGPEASARTAELLPSGTRVRLERDVEARDAFGRLLAYVHRVDDGLFVNVELVRQGYADVLLIDPNRAHAAELRAARADARAAGRGLWHACPAPAGR